jgi:hypothetical protein
MGAFLFAVLIKYNYTPNSTNDSLSYGLELEVWNILRRVILLSVDSIERLDSLVYTKLTDIEIIFKQFDKLGIDYGKVIKCLEKSNNIIELYRSCTLLNTVNHTYWYKVESMDDLMIYNLEFKLNFERNRVVYIINELAFLGSRVKLRNSEYADLRDIVKLLRTREAELEDALVFGRD